MSTEEEEIPVESQCTDVAPDPSNPTLSRPTKCKLNKNGKPRKVLSPEALEKLKLAREKANAIRKESYTKKLEDKVEKLKCKAPKESPIAEEPVVEEEQKVRPKGKKKTKIIVEQSSEDSDEFEPNDNVVFVKRVSRKKKEPVVEPVKEPELQSEIPPPPPPPVGGRQPEITPQQRVLKSQYESMFSGGFMNQNNLMRRHY